MNVLPNSDIHKGNSRVYLNAPELKDGKSGTQLFYESADSVQYYFLIRGYEVIATGVLRGYKVEDKYQYRFDFSTFIKIYNQDVQPITELIDGTYKFEGVNSCDLYFYVGNTDILNTNIASGKLIREDDGTVMLNAETNTYHTLTFEDNAFISFIDAGYAPNDFEGYELQYRLETQPIAQKGTYMPVTIYRNNIFMYTFIDELGEVIYQSPQYKKGPDSEVVGVADGYILTTSDNFVLNELSLAYIGLENGMSTLKGSKIGYVTYMVYIPDNVDRVSFAIFDDGGFDIIQAPEFVDLYPTIEEVSKYSKSVYGFKATDGCMKPYYFWNDNGAYDTVYCAGVVNKVEEIDKQYVNINGVETPIKITVTEKLKHNTGLTLKAEQVYSLIKAPQVNAITYGPINNFYNIDLETFEGYNGINLSERNIELMLSKPKNMRRYTSKNLTFFD